MKNKFLVLFVIIGLSISMVSCGESKKSDIYEIGQTGTITLANKDKYEVTVTSAIKVYVAKISPPTGIQFYYLPVKVKNISSQEVRFSPIDLFNILNSDGSYADDDIVDRGNMGLKMLTSANIKVGETVEGNIWFKITPDLSKGELLVFGLQDKSSPLLKFKIK